MKSYPEGFSVVLTVPFEDKEEIAVTPVAITARLLDGSGGLVTDLGAVSFDPLLGETQVTVAPMFNGLEEGDVRAVRQLEVSIETATTVVRYDLLYIIEAEQTLVPMVNTFQTLAAAELLAMDHVNLSGWLSADETRRRASLVEAYRRITNIPMKYGIRDADGLINPREVYVIDRDMWEEMNVDAFTMLPSHYRRQLRLAQFLEANELLQGDQILARHRAGIIQETIGESSVKLSGSKLDLGISTVALQALAGYVNYDMRVRRS